MEVEGAMSGEQNVSGNLDVGVRTLENGGVNLQFIFRRSGVDRAGGFQLHVGVIHQQTGEVCINYPTFRMLKISINADFSVRGSVSGNVLNVKRREQERIKHDVLHADFAAERIGVAEPKCVTAG